MKLQVELQKEKTIITLEDNDRTLIILKRTAVL